MTPLTDRLTNWYKTQKSEREETSSESTAPAPWLRVLGWTSVATGTLAVGYFVGRELRTRYRLNRRTPYDLYSHAGDNGNGVEFGVGV